MTDYVVGVIFCDRYDLTEFDYPFVKLALLTKKYPDWQAGYLNGIGGKIEAGERPREAMYREAEEETFGVLNRVNMRDSTEYCCSWKTPSNKVWFYSIYADHYTFNNLPAQNDVGESFEFLQIKDLPDFSDKMIPNLNFIIPLMYYGERSGVRIPLFRENC